MHPPSHSISILESGLRGAIVSLSPIPPVKPGLLTPSPELCPLPHAVPTLHLNPGPCPTCRIRIGLMFIGHLLCTGPGPVAGQELIP